MTVYPCSIILVQGHPWYILSISHVQHWHICSLRGSGANCGTQQARLLAWTQALTISNQCPKVTSLIPGRIRQPWKPPLQTFSNASKLRKSKYSFHVHFALSCSPGLNTTLSDTAAGASGRQCLETVRTRVSLWQRAVRVRRQRWHISARVRNLNVTC